VLFIGSTPYIIARQIFGQSSDIPLQMLVEPRSETDANSKTELDTFSVHGFVHGCDRYNSNMKKTANMPQEKG